MSPSPNDPVPLAVWPSGQTAPQHQPLTRYAEREANSAITPGLARRIISDYTSVGDLVVDPACGPGVVPLEAAALGRRSIGANADPVGARQARANVRHALPSAQRSLAAIHRASPSGLPAVLAGVTDRINCVITAPRSEDRAVAAASWALLGPGGLFIVVTRHERSRDRLTDRAAAAASVCREVGFLYVQHVIALRAAIREQRLHPSPTAAQLRTHRRLRARGVPASLLIHDDVLVFVKPGGAYER